MGLGFIAMYYWDWQVLLSCGLSPLHFSRLETTSSSRTIWPLTEVSTELTVGSWLSGGSFDLGCDCFTSQALPAVFHCPSWAGCVDPALGQSGHCAEGSGSAAICNWWWGCCLT